MKKTLLFSGILLALSAPLALAGGLNFAWGNNCYTDSPVRLRTFACNTNAGAAHQATGSFVLSDDSPLFVGIEAVVDLQSASPSLPQWWQFFNSGSCRSTSLSVSGDFTSVALVSCADPFNNQQAGGIAAYQTTATSPPVPNGLPNAARIKIAMALADPNPLSAGQEYLGFRLSINNLKTVGTGACAGCNIGVCLVFNSIKAAQNDGSSETATMPILNQSINWQGAGETVCAATPAQNATWGKVKSLYR